MNYNLKQPVKWSDILFTLRCELETRIYSYNKSLEKDKQNSIDVSKRLVLSSLEKYRHLRLFLGYRKKTLLEQEAEQLVKESTQLQRSDTL